MRAYKGVCQGDAREFVAAGGVRDVRVEQADKGLVILFNVGSE